MSDDSMRDYVDAVAEEQRRTDAWRTAAIVGTFGALIFGIYRATGVLAATFETRFQGTNEWRGTLEDQNKDKATVSELENVKEQVRKFDAELKDIGSRKEGSSALVKTTLAVIGAVIAINGAIFLFQGLGH